MILPIVAYGHPTLRKIAVEIEPGHPGLEELVENMFETMYSAEGVGLAAPQVNQGIRLFIVDAAPYAEDHPELQGFKKVFVNPRILETEGEEIVFNEGCLSIPKIREDVMRKPKVRMRYQDMQFNPFEETFEGITARIIQHEYDHLEATLFVDRINPLKKMLLKRKLTDITNGNIDVDYKMIFPGKKYKGKGK
ncbi:MAG TPA: peptide deformylase [Bacteroidales bacterium]|nr:peptide deformylase [Bacteroidales bacterium]HOX78261.1 peptide deformylase [Bacteroidales bacterium]HPI85838.1 peptide deformylase [Bacteroidales bacterium]HPM92337.1 peptide deformylase [Bacteroidales bacterium]